MNAKGRKLVRFADWSSESYSSVEQQNSNDGHEGRELRPSVSAVLRSIRRRIKSGSENIRSLRKSSAVHPASDGPLKKSASGRKVLDPQGPFLKKWNKIFVLTCVYAVSVDPFFFYIPMVDGKNKCLELDEPLLITVSVLRTFFDLFYVLHIIFQFKTGFIAPSSRVFGRGELVDDPLAIIKKYLCSSFIIDILSIIPMPQVIVLFIIPRLKKGSLPFVAKELLKYAVLVQCVPRLTRILLLRITVIRTAGILTLTEWPGAAFNLLVYMLGSHVVGAFWYLLSVESEIRCWRRNLRLANLSDRLHLSCENFTKESLQVINRNCTLTYPDDIKDSAIHNFGIFIDALTSQVVESKKPFHERFFYCFWWGMRSVSSLGQNLKTSTYVWEIIFTISIAIFGLFLLVLLFGINMERYLKSITVRVEEMKAKMEDIEQWMSHRMLPDSLRERIRQYELYKWQENRGVEEETLIRNLPKDLRRDVKRHLCFALLKKVPMFEKMDEQLLDAMSDRLKPILFTENSYIVREGDPVDEMLFIMRGKLKTATTNGGRTGFFNSFELKAGDFCGEELLTWALDSNSSNLPISTRTVETISEVEVFALMPDDLKFVASQFRRLHSKKLQYTFRFYSVQWRTWGACFIQATWRRYCKKKVERSLREAEDRLQDALANETYGHKPSLVATIFALRFAANAMRNLRQNGECRNRFPQRILSLLPQKPAEPDFIAQQH